MKITATDIKDYRAYYGLSQRAMAQILGVSHTYVAMFENEERRIPEYVVKRLSITYEQLLMIRQAKEERLALFPQYQKITKKTKE